MTAPAIETEGLGLRPHRMDDFASFAAFFASDAARHVGGPMPAARCWHGFAGDVGARDLLGFGGRAIEERATGAFAGQTCLSHPPHFPEAEIGRTSMPGFEGRGYAPGAARAARAHACGPLGWTTAVGYIEPDNARSIAVARRLGCSADPAAARFDPVDLVFRHPAPEACT